MFIRELIVVLFLPLILVLFYFSYIRAARIESPHRRKRKQHRAIVLTRWLLFLNVIVLAGLIGYDRFLSKPNIGKTTVQVTKKKPKKHINKQEMATAKSDSVSSSSSSARVTSARAVKIVEGYYARTTPLTDVDEYRFIQETRDANSSLVYEVGGYQIVNGTLQQTHDFQVHLDGKFDQIY